MAFSGRRHSCALLRLSQGSCLALQAVTRILHCGDMRWQPAMAQHPALAGQPLDVLYLDTTYAAPRHLHPPQVPHFSIQASLNALPQSALQRPSVSSNKIA
jgi:DNA cross-link repair 1A protein